jgi:biopolymer transport protein ExbD
MAYKPSTRSKGDDSGMELDIRPVMNLMVVLIPLLLAGAEWVKLAVMEINAPPAKNVGGPGPGENEDQKEKEKKLGLTVAIANDGITIGNAATLLENEEGDSGPTVPKNDEGEYDYEKLREKLIEIKKKIVDKGFVDSERATITASSNIEYQIIINVMDMIQKYKDSDGNELALFPQVNFGTILK